MYIFQISLLEMIHNNFPNIALLETVIAKNILNSIPIGTNFLKYFVLNICSIDT